jgi:multidrug efflux pump subunit AcrA (membrane-fusion protein)
LAPQLEGPIGDYVDLSHALTMDVIPLRAADDRESVGAMVFEQFVVSDAPPEHERGMDERAMAERVVRVASLGGSAVRNALDYNTLPLLNASRWARSWASGLGSFRRRRLIVVTGSISSIVLALMLIPATVYVKAEGELQPSIRRDIYAPLDGEVVDVPAVHDGDVVKDEILVLLRSRPLEIKLQGLQGEYQTTEKKLLAVASARVQSDSEDTGSANRPRQLAAEEQELKQSLLSQRKQMELVRQQRESLCVRSPINGRVLTWNPRELLEDRPVQRGQLLVSLADIDGPWGVELWVPDHQIGYILAAQRNHPLPLTVTFSLATDRRTSHQGRLQTVGARSESIDGQPASVRVTATVPKTAIDHLRPGARLYAKVDCGTRSLGYVWLHEIVDTLQAWLLF